MPGSDRQPPETHIFVMSKKTHNSFEGKSAPKAAAADQTALRFGKHWNILYVDSSIDDAGLSPRQFRELFHLHRRIAKRTDESLNPGLASIAKTCRVHRQHIMTDLVALCERGYFGMYLGRGGKIHRYHLIKRCKLYIDHRLDDAGLTVAEFRVLGHISRLADDIGRFFINYRKFASVCLLSRNTVKTALNSLEQKGYFGPYADRKNPIYFLQIEEKYPFPSEEGVKIGRQPCQNRPSKVSKEAYEGIPFLRQSKLKQSSEKNAVAFVSSRNGLFAQPPISEAETSSSATKESFKPSPSFNGSPLRCELEAAKSWRWARPEAAA
jgi:hypothetical protein